jgi:hypothetical protein
VMLTEFRAKYMARLLNLRRQLLERYPDRAQRIEYIVDVLSSKLQTLSVYTLGDYLHTVHLATREFPEFEELIPSEGEVELLLEWGEE